MHSKKEQTRFFARQQQNFKTNMGDKLPDQPIAHRNWQQLKKKTEHASISKEAKLPSRQKFQLEQGVQDGVGSEA